MAPKSKFVSFLTEGWGPTIIRENESSNLEPDAAGGESSSAADEVEQILRDLQHKAPSVDSSSSDEVLTQTHAELAEGAGNVLENNPLLVSLAETVFESDPATPPTPVEQLLDVQKEFAELAAGPEALVALVMKMLAKRNIGKKELAEDLGAHRARLDQEKSLFGDEALKALAKREAEAERAIARAKEDASSKRLRAQEVVAEAEAEAKRLIDEAKKTSEKLVAEASQIDAGLPELEDELSLRQADTVNTSMQFQAAAKLMAARINEIESDFNLGNSEE